MNTKSVAYSTELHDTSDPFVTLTLTMRRSMVAAFSACLSSPRSLAESANVGDGLEHMERQRRIQQLVNALMPDRDRDAFDTVWKAFREAAHIGVVYTPIGGPAPPTAERP